MPRRKKPVSEMTDAELERRVFPKKVLEELMRIAHEKDDEDEPKQNERSVGRLRTANIYEDSEAVLEEIAISRGDADRFQASMLSHGFVPESLFYVLLGWPDRFILGDTTPGVELPETDQAM